MSEEGGRPRIKHLDANYDRYKRSKRHEDRVAKRLGGRRLPRSGGLAWSRWDRSTAGADLGTAEFHIEHKRTQNKSISVTREWLEKVSEGARKAMKDPGLVLCFEHKTGEPDEWIAIPLEVFEKLLKAVETK